jgi:hypothetical protein
MDDIDDVATADGEVDDTNQAHAWEYSKENILPSRRGRRLEHIAADVAAAQSTRLDPHAERLRIQARGVCEFFFFGGRSGDTGQKARRLLVVCSRSPRDVAAWLLHGVSGPPFLTVHPRQNASATQNRHAALQEEAWREQIRAAAEEEAASAVSGFGGGEDAASENSGGGGSGGGAGGGGGGGYDPLKLWARFLRWHEQAHPRGSDVDSRNRVFEDCIEALIDTPK